MSVETTKDILEHVRDFHRQLSVFYGSLGERVEKERVKMLLNYLGRHEKHLEESLANYEAEVSGKILDAWFQFPPSTEILGICGDINNKNEKDLTVDDVIQLALKLDGCLIELYRKVIDSSELEEVRTVFENLLDLEKKEELELVRNSLELKDL